jgi:hypothetical protein
MAELKSAGSGYCMFQTYDVIRLKRKISGIDLPVGARGTILYIYTKADELPGFEVEFSDECGNALAVIQLQEEDAWKKE